MIHTLDLNHKNIDHSIASFLVETSAGPVLVESGPYSTYEALKNGLKKLGYSPDDLQAVLLTHIHFDHAGAAWALAEAGAKIYVHPFGAPHMQDPTKLYNSAKMIYGDEMETLWGIMKPIPEDQIVVPENGEEVQIGNQTFKALYTPGHARHHIAWQLDDVIFTGDVAGVKIGNGLVQPPCPPPDIDLEDWKSSIQILLQNPASKLYLTHFGLIENKEAHLSELETMLDDWSRWIKNEWESGKSAEQITPMFLAYTSGQLTQSGVDDHGLAQYDAANPCDMSVTGLVRYWKKQSGQ